MLLDSLAALLKMNRHVLIRDLNPNLVCVLCRGYFIDATTIVECVHSFCRACIVKHFESSKYCPICEVMVHKTKPLLSLKRDKTLQDIVYKLVPGLFAKEMSQRRRYYDERPHYVKPEDDESGGDVSEDGKSYICDDSIILSLNYVGGDSRVWHMRCPVGVSINHLKKLIMCKYGLDDTKVQVEILLNDQMLDSELTLLDIACLFPYRNKESLEFSFVLLKVKTKVDDLKETDAHHMKMAEEGNVVTVLEEVKVVEKEVQLQITETGIMSMSAIESLQGLTQLMEAPAPNTSLPPLSTVTALPPCVSSLSQAKDVTKKRLSFESRRQDAKKPKIDCKDDVPISRDKKPKRPSVELNTVVDRKDCEVILNDVSKKPSAEDVVRKASCSTADLEKTKPTEKDDKVIVSTFERDKMHRVDDNGKKSVDVTVDKSDGNTEQVDGVTNEGTERKSKRLSVEVSSNYKKQQNPNISCAPPLLTPVDNKAISTDSSLKKEIENERGKVSFKIKPANSISSKPPLYTYPAAKTSSHTPSPNSSQFIPETNSKEAHSSTSKVPDKPGISTLPASSSDKPDKPSGQKPVKHKIVRSSPEHWRPVITKEKLRPTLMSSSDEAKKPGKFFKMRNMPRFLGNPASGVKPMYSNGMAPESQPKTPPKKSEPIVRIDPKTLRPVQKGEQKSASMIMTNPFIPRDNKVVLPDPKTQPYGHFSPGFHASLPPSISQLLNPHQHFRNLKVREEAAATSEKHCDNTADSKKSASQP